MQESGLPTSMREHIWNATKGIHRKVEKNPFISALVNSDVVLPPAGLREYLQRKLVYMAKLEGELTKNSQIYRADPNLSRVFAWFERLFRVDAITKTIEVLRQREHQQNGETTPSNSPVPEAVTQYVTYLDALSRERPIMLLFHAWVNLMDGLFGGVVIARSIAKRFGEDVSAFVRFPEIIPPTLTMGEAMKVVKPLVATKFREPFDGYQWTEADYAEGAKEAYAAFEFNDAIFSAMSDLPISLSSGERAD